MPMSFYAGRQTPELELDGNTHEELVPLIKGPMLLRLQHWYDDDSEYSVEELAQLADEAMTAKTAAGTFQVRQFLEGLVHLVEQARKRPSGILVVRD